MPTITPVVDITTPNVQMHNDIVELLDHMDSQYVSPSLTALIKRLRLVVGTKVMR